MTSSTSGSATVSSTAGCSAPLQRPGIRQPPAVVRSNLLGHLNHLGGKGFGILFLRRRRVDRFRRSRRRFAFRGRFFNLLLGFYFLFCFAFLRLFFLTKAQPGKEATFLSFAICDYTPRC
jgi:hypothetical protein